MTPSRRTEIALACCSFGCAAILLFRWYVFLYEAPPERAVAGGGAFLALWRGLSSQSFERLWFGLSILLPAVCVAIGLGLVLGAPSRQKVASLTVLSVFSAVAAFALADWAVGAVLVCVGYYTWRQTNVA